ncbi:MAG: acyl carrier protein [Clostridiales bacterium]|nr:acyl carrier protein [Clostridiales bacterium]
MSHNTYDNIKEEVVKILENNGVVVEMENDGDAVLDIAAIDSITFISFIVDIENTFGIAIPDELLSLMIIQSLNGFVYVLSELLIEKREY